MAGPTIETLRRISRRYGSQRLVLFAMKGEEVQLVTYGENRQECKSAKRFGDRLMDLIEHGWLAAHRELTKTGESAGVVGDLRAAAEVLQPDDPFLAMSLLSAASTLEQRSDRYMALDALAQEIGKWADETFCGDPPEYRGPSIVAHLGREVMELGENPKDMTEMADCFILLCHLAHQNGGSFGGVVEAKMAVNRARKWGEPDAGGIIEHVREGE